MTTAEHRGVHGGARGKMLAKRTSQVALILASTKLVRLAHGNDILSQYNKDLEEVIT